jgi:hypothetical protein
MPLCGSARCRMVPVPGFEPGAFALSEHCANQTAPNGNAYLTQESNLVPARYERATLPMS